MELVFYILSLISIIAVLVWFVYTAINEMKKQKQRDEWLKSIVDDVKFLTTEAVNYEKK